MWIFDSYYKGCVELWGRENGLIKASAISSPSFYMHLKDPHAHREMIEALEDLYRVEECSFRTIFGAIRDIHSARNSVPGSSVQEEPASSREH